MRSQEVRALGELASEALGSVATRIEEMHEGIAERVFKSVGETAAPVRVIHDGIAHGVYAGLRGALGAAVRAGARAVSVTRPAEAPSIEQAPAARVAIGALNGLFGDRLEQEHSPFAARMTVRRGGEAIDLTAGGVRAAFPDATARIAVFLHGLFETEGAWSLAADRHVPYGPRLRVELGYTPVYIRYNSGRHISDNGRELAQLLDELIAVWPVEPAEIALIGHSMGGLIARSACHKGADRPWVDTVRHVFMLSCPHLGAPLERGICAASAALARLPETRSLATALNVRSCGIKDLRYGYLLEEDWFGRDPDAFHYWHIGGVHHFQLLNHPVVYEQIREWLSGAAIEPPPLELTAGPGAV